MQGGPEGLTVGFGLMLGDRGMFREAGVVIVGWVLLECGDSSMSRYLGNFYLGDKKNRSRLDLSLEKNQQLSKLASSSVDALGPCLCVCSGLCVIFVLFHHANSHQRVPVCVPCDLAGKNQTNHQLSAAFCGLTVILRGRHVPGTEHSTNTGQITAGQMGGNKPMDSYDQY